MTYRIKGILKLPDGAPAANCEVEFVSRKNFSPLVQGAKTNILTSATGAYDVTLELGEYAVILYTGGTYPAQVGTILLSADTVAGQDLPSLLQHDGWIPATPEYVQQIENWVASASQSASSAEASADAAADSAEQAALNGSSVVSREALRRSYADAGLNLVDGSFEEGGTLTSASDVLLHKASGIAYSGSVGQVVAGTKPLSGSFVDRSNELLRHELSSSGGSTLVGLNVGTLSDAVLMVSPSAYGAVMDGVNDDSAALLSMMADHPEHLIIAIPPGKRLTIKTKVVYTGRRLEIRGSGGVMTNKVPTSSLSWLYCCVDDDFSISCTQADIAIRDTLVSGIPQYSGGVIGTRKGINTDSGTILTSFVTFMGLALGYKTVGGFYNKFWHTEWLACKDCGEVDQPYNSTFFGCRAAGFNRFMVVSGAAGNGPINFLGCSFENFTNYIVGSDVALAMKFLNIGFSGCYIENFDNQSIYDGLTPRGASADTGSQYYRKYASARLVVGTPWSLSMDSGTTIYIKGIENLLIGTDAWGLNYLSFNAKLMESDWSSHQVPLSILRVLLVKTIDAAYNTTAGTGILSCPFITPNNSSLLPTINNGSLVMPGGRLCLFGNKDSRTLTFSSVAAGANSYVDVTYTSLMIMDRITTTIVSRSSTTAAATVQVEQTGSFTVRVHVTNTGTSAATFGVRLVAEYAASN